MSPDFLTLEEVVLIHRDQIDRYGGEPGIRDMKMLRSSLSMPRAGSRVDYFHGDVFEMAAAYLYHLVQSLAFVDGNKRVGTAAAIIFLDLNGVEVTADTDELVGLVLGVTAGHVSKADVAAFLRSRTQDA